MTQNDWHQSLPYFVLYQAIVIIYFPSSVCVGFLWYQVWIVVCLHMGHSNELTRLEVTQKECDSSGLPVATTINISFTSSPKSRLELRGDQFLGRWPDLPLNIRRTPSFFPFFTSFTSKSSMFPLAFSASYAYLFHIFCLSLCINVFLWILWLMTAFYFCLAQHCGEALLF